MKFLKVLLAIALLLSANMPVIYAQDNMPAELKKAYNGKYVYNKKLDCYQNKYNPKERKIYVEGTGAPPRNSLNPDAFSRQAALIDAYDYAAQMYYGATMPTVMEWKVVVDKERAEFLAKHCRVVECKWDAVGICEIIIEMTLED